MFNYAKILVIAGACLLGFWAGVRVVVLADYAEMVQGLQILRPLFSAGGLFLGAYKILDSSAAQRVAGTYARHRNRKTSEKQ